MRATRSSLAFFLAAAALAQTQDEPASLSGTVTHTVTGAPILRAHVTLRAATPNASTYGAMTNAEGKFSITGIPAGAYQAFVVRAGFFMPALPGGRVGVAVTLSAAEKKEDFKLRLAPLGSISGRVVDAQGEPVEDPRSSVSISGRATHRSATPPTTRVATTWWGCGPASTKSAPTFPPCPTPPEVRTDGTKEIRYGPTWYGGAKILPGRHTRRSRHRRGGQRHRYSAGAPAYGAHFRQSARRSARSALSKPRASPRPAILAAPAELRRTGASKSGTSIPASTSSPRRGPRLRRPTSPDRAHRCRNRRAAHRPPGTARDSAVRHRRRHRFRGRRRAPARAAAAGPPGQQGAAPRQAHSVSRSARADNRAPRIEVRTVDPGLYGTSFAISDVGPDGSFHLAAVPAARYRVMLTWPNAYVKSVTLGGTVAEGNVLNLRNGAAGAPLTVMLASDFGSISGTVSDASGPVEGARLALLRDDFVSLGDVTFAVTGEAGAYSLPECAPRQVPPRRGRRQRPRPSRRQSWTTTRTSSSTSTCSPRTRSPKI